MGTSICLVTDSDQGGLDILAVGNQDLVEGVKAGGWLVIFRIPSLAVVEWEAGVQRIVEASAEVQVSEDEVLNAG